MLNTQCPSFKTMRGTDHHHATIWLLFGMFDLQEQTYTDPNTYVQSFHNLCYPFYLFVKYQNIIILAFLQMIWSRKIIVLKYTANLM